MWTSDSFSCVKFVTRSSLENRAPDAWSLVNTRSQCVAVCCSVLSCVAVVAVCCRVLQCLEYFAVFCNEMYCVVPYCSVLQCVAVCHSALIEILVAES